MADIIKAVKTRQFQTAFKKNIEAYSIVQLEALTIEQIKALCNWKKEDGMIFCDLIQKKEIAQKQQEIKQEEIEAVKLELSTLLSEKFKDLEIIDDIDELKINVVQMKTSFDSKTLESK